MIDPERLLNATIKYGVLNDVNFEHGMRDVASISPSKAAEACGSDQSFACAARHRKLYIKHS